MGITYARQYEFPTKCFYFATSKDFIFKKFRPLNTQHSDKYDALKGPFTGDASHIYIKVEETNVEEQK